MKTNQLNLIIAFVLVCFLSSCSMFKMYEGHLKNKLERGDLTYQTIETEDYTLGYWDTGETDKPVYLLFHGFGSSTHFQWHQQAKLLSKTHRLILPNLLHFGSEPKGEEVFKMSDQVAAMSALVEALNIEEMVVGGISYGGVVAAELALQHPEKIDKITLFSTPVKYYNDDDLAKINETFQVNDIDEILVPDNHKMMRDLFRLTFYKPPPTPGFILKDIHNNWYHDEATCIAHKKVLAGLRAEEDELANRVYDFDCPVLLVWGTEDQLIPPRVGEQLNEHIPDSELHMIPKAGHAPCLEKTKKFNKILLAFLEEGEG